MEFNEALQQIDQFKETDDFKNYAMGFVTPDRVKEFLSTEEGKKLVQPDMDKYFSKGLESWKANNLEKMINDEIQNRNPSADPKDIELANVKAQLEAIQKESTRKDLKNQALKIANEKSLPVELVDYLIGDDEKSTLKNLETFEKAFQSSVSAMVDKKLPDVSHIPNGGIKEKELSVDDLNNMSIDQINDYYKNLQKLK